MSEEKYKKGHFLAATFSALHDIPAHLEVYITEWGISLGRRKRSILTLLGLSPGQHWDADPEGFSLPRENPGDLWA